MKNTYVRCIAVCTISLGLSGCGSDGIALESLDEAYVDAICEQVRSCPGSLGEIGLITSLLGGDREATCEELLTNIGFASAPREGAGIEGGTIVYDAGAAKRCVDELARSCRGTFGIEAIDECQRIFVGQIAVGDMCQATSQCEPGSYCLTTEACGGTCTAKVATGALCDRSEECLDAPGSVADCTDTIGNPDNHCVQTAFETDRALGEACGDVGGDGDTQTYAVCAAGLYCRTENSDVGTCATPLELGATCTEDDLCLDSVCSEVTGVCTSITVRTNVGETCDEETYTICDARLHLTCSEAGVCEALGDGTAGSVCENDTTDFLFTLFTCNDGLVCVPDGANGVCAAPRADGAACEDDIECQSGYCSDAGCSAPVLCEL